MSGPSPKALDEGREGFKVLDPEGRVREAAVRAAYPTIRADVIAELEDVWIDRWNELISGLHVALGKPGEGLDSVELVEAVKRLRVDVIAEIVASLRQLVEDCPPTHSPVGVIMAADFIEREFGDG